MRVALLAGLFCLISSYAFGAEQARPVGVARIDITPDFPIRLCGYAARKMPSEGVEEKLWAKAMAIGDDGDLAIIVTVDNTAVGANVVEEIAQRMEKKFKIPRERFVLCS